MIKANIIKNNSIVQSALFQNQTLADNWIESLIENKTWGEPDSWTYSFEDNSLEEEKKQYFANKDKNETFGKRMLRELQFINHKKLSLGQMTVQEALNLKKSMEQIQGHLLDGDIELARGLIDLYPTDHIITSEVKQGFLNMIDAYLGG